MKFTFTILSLLFLLSVGRSQLPYMNSQPPLSQPEMMTEPIPQLIIESPLGNDNPYCNYPVYMYCELCEPCLGIYASGSGEQSLSSPTEHAVVFYIWSEYEHQIEADMTVDEDAGNVELKSIVWEWWKNNNHWQQIVKNNSGEYNNWTKTLKPAGGDIYRLILRVYPEKVVVDDDANGEYWFKAQLTVNYDL